MQVIEATGVKWRERGYYPTIRKLRNGIEASRHFIVNTDDPVRALDASGVPSIGDAFDASLPDVLATSIEPAILGGTDIDDETYGWHAVTVRYRSASLNPQFVGPAGFNDDFTTIEQGTRSQSIRADIDGNAIPETTRNVGVLRILVHLVRESSYFAPLTIFQSIRDKTNENTVQFPPFFGDTTSDLIIAAPDQLLAVSARASLIETALGQRGIDITLAFDWATDHLFRWREEDENGNPESEVIESRIYESVPYPEPNAGLWTTPIF